MWVKGKLSTYDISWTTVPLWGSGPDIFVPIIRIYKITSFFGLFTIKTPGWYIATDFGTQYITPKSEERLFKLAVESYENEETPWVKDT